jgi:hypothetical protein
VVQLLELVLALILLSCGVYVGWQRWVGPVRAELDSQATGMLMLVILAVVGGAVGSPFWWRDDPNSFSWMLPPLAARLLGSAAAAFALTGYYALEHRSERLVRTYVALLAVYLAPLVVVILLLHLDRFNWHAPISYAFFVIAGGMALAANWHLVRRTTLGAGFADKDEPVSPPIALRCWLWAVAISAGLWGISLFVYPTFPWPEVFIWPRDALTSRLIAAMLLTLSTAAVLGMQSTKQARMSLWMFIAYGIGAAAACLWNAVAGNAVPVSYAGAFCGLALGSIFCMLYVRPRSILIGQ